MNRTRFLFANVMAAGVLLASHGAWAEEEKAGLPQLDVSKFPEQLFWLAISFGILYVLMTYVALPKVKDTQDKRGNTIAADIAAAQAANEAARSMMAQYEKALADARAQAQATVSEISAQAAKESATRQAAQQQVLAKRLAEAEAKIAAARDVAIKDVKTAANDLATAIVDKVGGGKVRAGGER